MFAEMGVALILFWIFVAILWVLLPFAVFGIKKRLDKTNELLESTWQMLNRLDDNAVHNTQDIVSAINRK